MNNVIPDTFAVYHWERQDLSRPIETPSGKWKTRLVEENINAYDDNFARCSTFIPNVTIHSGVQQQIIIDLDAGYLRSPPNELPSWSGIILEN